MRVNHHFMTINSEESKQRQKAIHRKCLLLLCARADRVPAASRRTG